MPAAVTYRAYGRTVRVVAPEAALEHMADRLPPAYRSSDGTAEAEWRLEPVEAAYRVFQDGAALGSAPDLAAGTELLLSHLELWVAEHARRYVFVHAGCVVHSGRAIVFPGRSMSGKSSLTAALVRAGATYYSDEYAVVDPRGRVRPYPRKLAIRPYDGSLKRRVSVEELGGVPGRGPAVVGLVAVLQFGADAGWSVRQLSPGEAVLRLIDNTVPARSRPRAVLTALGELVETARAVQGTRGDADEAAAHLLELLHSGRDV